MKTIKNAEFRELVPDEGKVLTQAGNVPDSERIYATAVALGKGARVDRWIEVDPPEPADGWEDPDILEGDEDENDQT